MADDDHKILQATERSIRESLKAAFADPEFRMFTMRTKVHMATEPVVMKRHGLSGYNDLKLFLKDPDNAKKYCAEFLRQLELLARTSPRCPSCRHKNPANEL